MSGHVILKKVKRAVPLDFQIISCYDHDFRIVSRSVFCLKKEHTYINQKLVIIALLSLAQNINKKTMRSSVQISLISEQRNLHLHSCMHMHTTNCLHSYHTQTNNNLNKKLL